MLAAKIEIWIPRVRAASMSPAAGAGGDGKLYGFRGTDGKLLAAVVGGAAPIRAFETILSANGRLYVAAQGAIYAFAY
jgi:hypothetical protein